jgi:hypothetical protein
VPLGPWILLIFLLFFIPTISCQLFTFFLITKKKNCRICLDLPWIIPQEDPLSDAAWHMSGYQTCQTMRTLFNFLNPLKQMQSKGLSKKTSAGFLPFCTPKSTSLQETNSRAQKNALTVLFFKGFQHGRLQDHHFFLLWTSLHFALTGN